VGVWLGVLGVQLDDRQRADLRQLQVQEWGLRDKAWKERWVHLLDEWKTAGGVAAPARLRAGMCRSAVNSLGENDSDAVGTYLLARSALAQNPDGIAMPVLLGRQQRFPHIMGSMKAAPN